ncbi:unnamed protein product [Merluccius merluccius]
MLSQSFSGSKTLCDRKKEIGGNEVSWRHLEDFYLQDKKNVIRMAPKLTERHIHLPPFTNMSVKLATQNLFSVIRGKGGHRFHPTAREFSAALRSASVGSIIGIQGCNTNCIPDDATQLLQGNPHPDASYVEQEGGQEGEQEALTYVAGWVTKKVAEEPDLGQCWECERVLVKRNNREHSYSTATREGSFIQAKKFHSSASLHEPTEAFQACIARCESSIKRELPRVWAAKGLAQKVKEALQRSGAFDEIHLQHPTHSKAIEAIALKKFIIWGFLDYDGANGTKANNTNATNINATCANDTQVLDQGKAYHQGFVSEESRACTAFITPWGIV